MLVACSHLRRRHANLDVRVLLLLFVYRPAYPRSASCSHIVVYILYIFLLSPILSLHTFSIFLFLTSS
ncbi:hypothetical protein BO79DRAFT_41050 [Aspergillus costaricaensis CBS 115574]|uniref:Uncharacterized protein n=1 Tax=Aspergillus costaricaensis CBS 115574 TaxID=1448317 RepID=A0ACD1I658_9EURO|nr:hypothetical protein BO79DRAFT_41050 [Aspergillus costaricaensis CBS 115574]RAK85808.1 hypothetical protein BO79DRAFT_41050 [Aspergillus costaricaensis CBS 115574]